MSFSSLLAGFIFGICGIFIFRYGRKHFDVPLTLIGIALMTYGLFTHGPLQNWGIGLGLCALAYWLHRRS